MPLPATEIGYTFQNYTHPAGEWGAVLTADDMRYTYMYGISLVAGEDGREATDGQLSQIVEMAMAEIERALDIVIRKRIYRTNYAGTDSRTPKYRTPTDVWTHNDDAYMFLKRDWTNQGYIQLNHRPLLTVERAILKTPVDQMMIDLKSNNWLRLDKASGQIWLFPRIGTSYPIYGPYLGASGLILDRHWGDYNDAFEFDYTCGYENSDFVPEDLRQIVGELAAVGTMNIIGDGLLAGFSSSSVSLDGLSESFSSTQSPENKYFGARIREYREHIKKYLIENRYKFGGSPILVA
jgi:hypothetical protein